MKTVIVQAAIARTVFVAREEIVARSVKTAHPLTPRMLPVVKPLAAKGTGRRQPVRTICVSLIL